MHSGFVAVPEIVSRSQVAGQHKVHDGPEVANGVFDGCPGQGEAGPGAQASHGLGDLSVGIADETGLIEEGGVIRNGGVAGQIAHEELIAGDDEVGRGQRGEFLSALAAAHDHDL